MVRIHTIETDPRSPFGEPEVPPAEWTYRAWRAEAVDRGVGFIRAYLAMASERSGREYRDVPLFPTGMSLERTVAAYVNHGRWLWDCPICNAAQVCAAGDERAFCIECFNAGDGWWPVVWPDSTTRAQIEELLVRRPAQEQRSWYPHEPLEQLQLENLSIGADPDLPGLPWPGAQPALALVRETLGLPATADQPALEEG